MKKKLILALESLLLVMAFLIDYISRNKLALTGKISYINSLLEASLSQGLFKLGLILVFSLILVVAARSYREREAQPMFFWSLVILVMVSILSLTMLDKGSHMAYYFLNVVLAGSTVLQAMAYKISLD